jgi:hypothetical protein
MSAKFFYYPEPNGLNLVTIDLGEDLGELFSEFFVDARDGITQAGQMNRSVGRMTEIVRIQRDRLSLGEDLAYKFAAMQNHLDRGFSVAFTADHTKAWAAPCQGLPLASTRSLNVYGSPFVAFADPTSAGFKPAANDFLILETAPPGMLHEQLKVDNVSGLSATQGGLIGLDNRIAFAYSQPAFVRHYRFWPVLKRREQDVGRNIITNEGGRLFSLDVTLVPDYRTLFAFHPEFFGDESNLDIAGLLTTLIPDSDTSGNPDTTSGGGGICGGIDKVPGTVNGREPSAGEQPKIPQVRS